VLPFDKKPESDADARKWRAFGLAMSIPFMLATGPLLGYFIGRWLDGVFGTSWIQFVMLFLGFIAGVRSVIRVLKEDLPQAHLPVQIGESIQKAEPQVYIPASDNEGYVDSVEDDGEIVGTMSYSRRIASRANAGFRSQEDDGSDEAVGEPRTGEGDDDIESTEGYSAARISVDADANSAVILPMPRLLNLPGIIATGIWITLLLAAIIVLLWSREVALGIIAGGLWNVLNFAVLWLTFKTAFSSHPFRMVFTLLIVCIKIPLLYSLVIGLFRLNLFDHLGMVIGLVVLPAVILFLAILEHNA